MIHYSSPLTSLPDIIQKIGMAAVLNVHQYNCDFRLHGGPCLEEAEAALHAFGLSQRISSKRFPNPKLDMFVRPILSMFPG
jgi:hypothetical protein